MKIAIYHNLPSGGGKRALYEMIRRLAQRHEVDVYTLSCAEHNFCDLRPHCRQHIVFPFRPLPLARRPFGRLNQGIRSADLRRLESVQRQIAAQIDSGNDVVFVHNCQFGQSPGLLKYLRTPSVYYCQEPPRQLYEPPTARLYDRLSQLQRVGNLVDPFPGLYRWTLRRLDRANTLAATTVLVNSHYSRETFYRTYGIFATVCYLGVDLDLFQPFSLEKGNFVLSVGQLGPRKGFDFLLLGLARVESAKRPSLIIASNFTVSAEKTYLAQLAREQEVNVDFRAMISDAELVRLYNQALATVYAPIMEPFGFVPLESMACGTPVVGVREAGVRKTVIHNVTELLSDWEPEMFAAALAHLLADPERAGCLGQNSLRSVRENWNWDASLQGLEKSLEAAAGRCVARRR